MLRREIQELTYRELTKHVSWRISVLIQDIYLNGCAHGIVNNCSLSDHELCREQFNDDHAIIRDDPGNSSQYF